MRGSRVSGWAEVVRPWSNEDAFSSNK